MTQANAALRRAKRIDEACDQFEAAWRAGQNPQIEAFLAKVSPIDQDGLRSALQAVERELKSQSAIDTSASQSSVATPREPASDYTAMYSAPKDGLKRIGRFEIRGVLGAGAFGKIYRGYDAHLGRDVAIKVPLAAVVKNENDKDRFLKEARSAAKLNHPNVCQIYEVGEFENMPYIVMPVIPGQSLADAIKSRKEPLPEKQVAQIVRKIASAISAAHEKGIIHRDLKPANVMFDKERKDMIVMDFGLARGPILGEARATQSGMILGTPAYMSPEQARGASKDVGPAADIFSLGVILYELLSGQRPFTGTATEVIGQILHVEPKAPSIHRAGIDPRLENACRKAMAKNPAERFQSMGEFAAAIDQYLKFIAAATTESDTARVVGTKNDAKDSSNEKDKLAEVFAAISAERKVSAAVDRAVSRHKTPTWIWVALALLMLGGFGALGGIIFFTRSDKVKVDIAVIIHDLDLQDKSLSFFLDEQPISTEKLASPVELKPGVHFFTAKRGDEIVNRFEIRVTGGNKPGIKVEKAVTPKSTTIASPDLKRWQGTWKCVTENSWGSVIYENDHTGKGPTQTITGTNRELDKVSANNKTPIKQSKFQIDETASPKTFDCEEFGFGDNKFRQSGIYEFSGNRLRLVYRFATGEHPKRATWADIGQKDVHYYEFERDQIAESAKAANGWTELFNGKDLSNWRMLDGTAANWKVQDGYLEVAAQSAPITSDSLSKYAIVTEKNYPLDFELHAEFWLPKELWRTDQARANSGIYLLGRHEIQICDSFENRITNPKHACGALFNQIPVSENANLPPETWQTFDITYRSPRVGANEKVITPGRLTVVLNGKTVINDATIQFALATGGGASTNEVGKPGPILLQAHGSPVRFRNLRIRPLQSVDPVQNLAPPDAKVFQGHTYKFFPEQLSWKEAKAKCEALGGHLIVMENAEENAFAAKLIENSGWVDSWFGATDEAKEGDWRTVAGEPLAYTNWFKRQNQPNNKGAGEHFGLMSNRKLNNGDTINWEWSDQPNEAQTQHKPGYLCEWDSQ